MAKIPDIRNPIIVVLSTTLIIGIVGYVGLFGAMGADIENIKISLRSTSALANSTKFFLATQFPDADLSILNSVSKLESMTPDEINTVGYTYSLGPISPTVVKGLDGWLYAVRPGQVADQPVPKEFATIAIKYGLTPVDLDNYARLVVPGLLWSSSPGTVPQLQ